MTPRSKLGPHEIGLPAGAIRRRRHARRVARIMLIVAGLTALGGWLVLGRSIFQAVNLRAESPYEAIVAYGILIVSSVTLILGLWYLLLAQVERVARIVESDDASDDPGRRLCGNCGWFFDPPDRYCRHCGKPLGASIVAPSNGGSAAMVDVRSGGSG